MGYESLETDSMITLKTALEGYRKSIVKKEKELNKSQIYKDATYELDRINSELNNR